MAVGGKAEVIYDQAGVTIICGDWRDALAAGLLPDAWDHTIEDPPYDEETHEGAAYGFRAGWKSGTRIEFPPLTADDIATLVQEDRACRWSLHFCAIESLGRYAEAAGGKRTGPRKGRYMRSGLWVRPNGAPQFTGDRPGQPAEGIAILHADGASRWNGKGKHGMWTHNVPPGGKSRWHRTQKPMALMLELVADFSDEGDLIVDRFCGSGTTLLAARNLGRRAIGCEIDPERAQNAALRLRQDAEQGRLFA